MFYNDYERNHVIFPGREKELDRFLNIRYKGELHKKKNSSNSHSEDALTWSCFDYISQKSPEIQKKALQRIIEDSFEGNNVYQYLTEGDIKIFIGKQYKANKINETTEVDASIETDKYLIFFEAKLYSAISLENPPERKYNQIAKKIRVGQSKALEDKKNFIFIIIDIAPYKMLNRKESKLNAKSGSSGFNDKWKTAWWFDYYKNGRNNSKKPLSEIVKDIPNKPCVDSISNNMGWITWSDLFKTVLFTSI